MAVYLIRWPSLFSPACVEVTCPKCAYCSYADLGEPADQLVKGEPLRFLCKACGNRFTAVVITDAKTIKERREADAKSRIAGWTARANRQQQ